MSSQNLSALERLPNELLVLIHGVLDDVSAVCLQNTNSNLKIKLHRDPTSFSRCTKWLIMCRFEQDQSPATLFGQYPKEGLTCGACKAKRTLPQIAGWCRSGRRGINFPVFDPVRLFVEPEKRYCAKHPFFITWVKPSLGEVPEEAARWVTTQRLTCLHCFARVQSTDTRPTGCDNCKCDVCPRIVMNEFIRYGKLPKAARAGRPYIDALVDIHGDRTNMRISEVGSKSLWLSILSSLLPGPPSFCPVLHICLPVQFPSLGMLI